MIASRICPLIDWYQAVFNDSTIEDVMTSIGANYLITDDVEKVLAERFYISEGYLTSLVFNFNGIIFKVRGYDLQQLLHEHGLSDADELDVGVFEWLFPYINLTLSGQTLEFLRQSGVDVNTILFNPLPMEHGTYHVTRVDFAFDLVNYMPNFLDDCLDQIKRSALPTGRLMSIGGKSGMCYTARVGNKEKTLYLGSTKSNKLLRIYDKNLQFATKQGSNPYRDGDVLPSSWIRLELQCRRESECHKLLYNCEGDMMMILRYIYDNFALVESDGSAYGKERHVSECWKNLFDWEGIKKIIQNANCVELIDVLSRAENYVQNSAFSSLCIFAAFYSSFSILDLINSKFADLQLSNDPLDQRRFNTLLSKILSVNGDLPPYIKYEDGIYKII